MTLPKPRAGNSNRIVPLVAASVLSTCVLSCHRYKVLVDNTWVEARATDDTPPARELRVEELSVPFSTYRLKVRAGTRVGFREIKQIAAREATARGADGFFLIELFPTDEIWGHEVEIDAVFLRSPPREP